MLRQIAAQRQLDRGVVGTVTGMADSQRQKLPGEHAESPAHRRQFTIAPEQAAALDDAVIEAGVRFVGLDNGELVFEVHRTPGSRHVALREIAETARNLLMDGMDHIVAETLAQAAAHNIPLKFY